MGEEMFISNYPKFYKILVKLAAAHPAAELRGMQGAAALLSR